MRPRPGVLVLFLTAAFGATSAQATIISGSVTGGTAAAAGGSFVKLTVPLSNPFGHTPNSVGKNNYQSSNLFGFDEDQDILLGADLTVDVGSTPIYAGTMVASHYIFFDPRHAQTIVGTVNFDAEVLGIFTSTASLIASDWLADTGVNYLSPTLRGLEKGDLVSISGQNQILFQTEASSPGDYVRVLTRVSEDVTSRAVAVPEPATLPLFATAFAGFWLAKRRKSDRRRPSSAGPIRA